MAVHQSYALLHTNQPQAALRFGFAYLEAVPIVPDAKSNAVVLARKRQFNLAGIGVLRDIPKTLLS